MAYLKVYRQAVNVVAAAGLVALVGCTTRTSGTPDQQVRQQAAADASQVHHDLKVAGAEARQALLHARTETKAAVAGARQGWKENGGSSSGAVDINHASRASLEALPGIHASTAKAIVAGRPYDSAHQLVTRGVISSAEYDRIADQMTAR